MRRFHRVHLLETRSFCALYGRPGTEKSLSRPSLAGICWAARGNLRMRFWRAAGIGRSSAVWISHKPVFGPRMRRWAGHQAQDIQATGASQVILGDDPGRKAPGRSRGAHHIFHHAGPPRPYGKGPVGKMERRTYCRHSGCVGARRRREQGCCPSTLTGAGCWVCIGTALGARREVAIQGKIPATPRPWWRAESWLYSALLLPRTLCCCAQVVELIGPVGKWDDVPDV